MLLKTVKIIQYFDEVEKFGCFVFHGSPDM